MRNLITILLLISTILVVKNCWADCTGKPVKLTIGSQKEILVESQYTIDGNIQAPNDIHTYFPEDWNQLSDVEVKQKISDDISEHCKQLIFVSYSNIKGRPIDEVRSDIFESVSSRFTDIQNSFNGISTTQSDSETLIDSDGDRFYDQKWIIKSDGSKSIVAIDLVAVP